MCERCDRWFLQNWIRATQTIHRWIEEYGAKSARAMVAEMLVDRDTLSTGGTAAYLAAFGK